MKNTNYEKAINDLHEAKMKQISINYTGMITEIVLTTAMCIALVTLLFI